MHLAYDPTSPFENLADQVKNAIDFSSAGNSPYLPKQIVTAACNLIHETGAWGTYCKDWRVLSDNEQTWEKFKDFFSKAHHYLCEAQILYDPQITVAGYQANIATHG